MEVDGWLRLVPRVPWSAFPDWDSTLSFIILSADGQYRDEDDFTHTRLIMVLYSTHEHKVRIVISLKKYAHEKLEGGWPFTTLIAPTHPWEEKPILASKQMADLSQYHSSIGDFLSPHRKNCHSIQAEAYASSLLLCALLARWWSRTSWKTAVRKWRMLHASLVSSGDVKTRSDSRADDSRYERSDGELTQLLVRIGRSVALSGCEAELFAVATARSTCTHCKHMVRSNEPSYVRDQSNESGYEARTRSLPFGLVSLATAINAPTKAKSRAIRSQRKNDGACLLRKQHWMRVEMRV